MQKFILFYKGPATPSDASHAGWPEWFGKMGDRLVDRGFPLTGGFTLQHDGKRTDNATNYKGFSIVEAEDRDEVVNLLKDHPYFSLGSEYTIEIFELPH